MKQLTTVLILILASTNASKYFRPDHQFQQDPLSKDKYKEMLLLALIDDRYPPRLTPTDAVGKWDSPPDPRMFYLNDLDSLENYLQEDPNDFRMKRTKTSLSIDNSLDVLRQQYFKALARQKLIKSIERNREHFLKTGKRSPKNFEYQVDADKQSSIQSKNTQKDDFLANGLEDSPSQITSNEQTPTTRRYQNRLDDLSYQT